ncbi:MAG: hypothetical protein FJ220_06970 [Kiritimatiellaceae bacterium]|nr:hypothetical protein [Kiritimatiellaceae bacterium]
MKTRLNQLREGYAELERGVQELVQATCSSTCALCTSCCCRADICEEALESPFLRELHQQDDLLSDRYGFLTESGCSLPQGRPPICYEFFCDGILSDQPDELYRDVLRILGRLPAFAGENALNGQHLTEIMDASQLEKINFEDVEAQLQLSLHALEIIQAFYTDGTLTERSRQVLGQIGLVNDD